MHHLLERGGALEQADGVAVGRGYNVVRPIDHSELRTGSHDSPAVWFRKSGGGEGKFGEGADPDGATWWKTNKTMLWI
jgi:hypothetical protein